MKEKLKDLFDIKNIERFVPISTLFLPQGEEFDDDLENLIPNNYFIMTANGNGMINAGICDGDSIMFKRTSVAQNNSLVAVMFNDGSTAIRRYLTDGKTIALRREDNKTPDMINPIFQIFGEVVSVHRVFQRGEAN